MDMRGMVQVVLRCVDPTSKEEMEYVFVRLVLPEIRWANVFHPSVQQDKLEIKITCVLISVPGITRCGIQFLIAVSAKLDMFEIKIKCVFSSSVHLDKTKIALEFVSISVKEIIKCGMSTPIVVNVGIPM